MNFQRTLLMNWGVVTASLDQTSILRTLTAPFYVPLRVQEF